jgi:hypothetical protein
MATVEGLLYRGGHLGSDYGSTTIQPWTIGWDEEDTRIRLKQIARAWIDSRNLSPYQGGTHRAELVRAASKLSHNFASASAYMAVVVQSAVAAEVCRSAAVWTLTAHIF